MAKKARLTEARLAEILRRRLALKDPEWHFERFAGRIIGDIVSASFRGKRDHERQQLIWDALDAELGVESASLVGMLLAYTPDEWDVGSDRKPATRRAKKAG
jgi:acid stress-induced BolA-like protein IbaG/YrbA